MPIDSSLGHRLEDRAVAEPVARHLEAKQAHQLQGRAFRRGRLFHPGHRRVWERSSPVTGRMTFVRKRELVGRAAKRGDDDQGRDVSDLDEDGGMDGHAVERMNCPAA